MEYYYVVLWGFLYTVATTFGYVFSRSEGGAQTLGCIVAPISWITMFYFVYHLSLVNAPIMPTGIILMVFVATLYSSCEYVIKSEKYKKQLKDNNIQPAD